MSEEDLAADTRVPDRYMDKQEAIRHLIHAAIRLVQKHEDPFAIHLLVHSADKMLIDLAKKRGQEPRIDWELYIKPEYHKVFFKKIRATYNYLKHADTDFDEKLPVRNIMMLNASAIFLCLANYSKLFGELTKHMLLFHIFMLNIWPQLLKPDAAGTSELLKATEMTQGMTPKEFFGLFDKRIHDLLPGFYREVTEDLKDTVDFYHLAFYELREGQTKSSRIIRIPEY